VDPDAVLVVPHSCPQALAGGGLSASAGLGSRLCYLPGADSAHWKGTAGDSVVIVVRHHTVTHSSAVQNDSRLETVGPATSTRSRWCLENTNISATCALGGTSYIVISKSLETLV